MLKILIFLPLLIVAVTAPFGTTICGLISLSQIRRSNGCLYGLPLALFDAIFFPLLVLTGLIYWFWTWFYRGLLHPDHMIFNQQNPDSSQLPVSWFEQLVYHHDTALVMGSTLLTAGILCTFLARQAWHAANKPLNGTIPPAPRKSSRLPIALAIFAASQLATLALAVLLHNFHGRDAIIAPTPPSPLLITLPTALNAPSTHPDPRLALDLFKALQTEDLTYGAFIKNHDATGALAYLDQTMQPDMDRLQTTLNGTPLQERTRALIQRCALQRKALHAQDWKTLDALYNGMPDKTYEHDLTTLAQNSTAPATSNAAPPPPSP